MLPEYVAEGSLSPREWGAQLREVVDRHLHPDNEGMVLLHGMPTATAAEFSELMAGCSGGTWAKRAYEPFSAPRKVLDGVDLATNIPSQMMLTCHNEMIYNPHPCDFIVLACNQPAHSGGESLMARNADFTARVPSELQDFVKAHGGLRSVRRYFDATADTESKERMPWEMSWQRRCGLDESSADRAAAAAVFIEKFGPEIEIVWEEDGSGDVVVSNTTPGFNGAGDWCNVMAALFPVGVAAADGTPVPEGLVEGLKEAEAAAYRALRLEAGDLWVVDNMRIAHGRLPYEDAEGSQRTLFTHLADYVQP